MKLPKSPTKIAQIIFNIIQFNGDSVSWSTITSEIESLYEVKDWTIVRNALQLLKNNGTIERTDSVFVEEYIVL